MMINKRNDKGITLVALVVTMVVIMILGTIVYNSAVGKNGLITLSKEMKQNEIDSQTEADKKIKNLEDSYSTEMGKGLIDKDENSEPVINSLKTINLTETGFTVKIVLSDYSGSGINKVEYCLDGGNYVKNPDGPTSKEYTFSNLDKGSKHKVNARVTNNYGKTTEQSLNVVLPLSGVYTFTYTGDVQKFIVKDSGKYRLEVWGAQGGYRNSSDCGGLGGYSVGEVNLTSGTTLYIYVGGEGGTGTSNTSTIYPGGYNGGGYRYGYNGGGGATDIRLVGGAWNDSTSLLSRFIVAGGGGSDGRSSATGGYGGGTAGETVTSGYSYSSSICGYNGTQTYSGSSTSTNGSAQVTTNLSGITDISKIYGGFGFGGAGVFKDNGYGGAGGGGWYGGAGTIPDGSADDDRAGGGGSGFVLTESTIGNVPSGYSVNSSYYLTNASTTTGGSLKSSGTSHLGNGSAVISYLGE